MYIPDDVSSIIKDYHFQFKIVENKKKLLKEFKNNYVFEFKNKETNILDIKKNKFLNYYLNSVNMDGELYGNNLQYMKCIQQKKYKNQKGIIEYQENYKTPKNNFDKFFNKPGISSKIYTIFDNSHFTELYDNNIVCIKKNSKYHIDVVNCDD